MEAWATDCLYAGLEALGITTDTGKIALLQRYLVLIERWNRVYNLTSIEGGVGPVTHHLLDSLATYDFIQGKTILDVGSGAGFPGIPLAIYQPERLFTLLDARTKRVRFLRQCILDLNLKNVTPLQARIERYTPERGFDTVISRAFGTLADLLVSSRTALAPGGHVLAMKGRYPADELNNLPPGAQINAVHSLHVPGLNAERHLIDLGWKSNGNGTNQGNS